MKCLFVLLALAVSYSQACTITTASGTRAPAAGSFCAGQVIFEDNFAFLDQSIWRHEITLSGGGNWEFQWYLNDRFNSFATGGVLHIVPTFTADVFGEDFLRSGLVRIPLTECTDDRDWGCERQGGPDNIINPIRSAKITTINSFNFKFGILEIRAKLPGGDWVRFFFDQEVGFVSTLSIFFLLDLARTLVAATSQCLWSMAKFWRNRFGRNQRKP